MPYNVTGTAGNDTLNQSGDTGPGTIVGLAGDDTISLGSGPAQVFGNSGNDSVLLQIGNTGTVNGGTENDSIFGPAGTGSMQLFGSDGADTIDVASSSAAQTIVGGNDSTDGSDRLFGGTSGDLMYGNGGNDSLFDAGGSDTHVGGFGNDNVSDQSGSNFVFGNQGNDTIGLGITGSPTAYAGLGNDLLSVQGSNVLLFGNEGADTFQTQADSATLVGGQDSADGGDLFNVNLTGPGFVLGNGGADSINLASPGSVTAVGGHGNDNIVVNQISAGLLFGNEDNDSFLATSGAHTVFGGLGNDSILLSSGRDSVQGNEGNDTIRATGAIDTISGGTGNDVFLYLSPADDGNNADGGGPVEFITDLNFAEDKFDTTPVITFATNTGAGTGADLADSANNAINAATALNGGVNTVAAQFTFGGHTYLAINLAVNGFVDTDDLLLDITGFTGTISNTNFI